MGQPALLDRLQREVDGSPGFASRMRTTAWHDAFDSATGRTEFAKFAATYQVSLDAELCNFALQLAFSPSSVRFEDPDKGAGAFERLAQVPSLARGAFLARLVMDLAERNLAAKATV
jgi:hypothetical protein